MSPSEFITTIFCDTDGFLSLWRGDTKATLWTKPSDAKRINNFIDAANAESFNAYFGVCLHRMPPEQATSRGKEHGVCIMPGLWADVDFQCATKVTSKRYPTEAQAKSAIQKMPVLPTITVLTGGGLHCYWLFRSPLKINNSNRAVAKQLSMSWQQMLRDHLLEMGEFDLDSTHDLTRVLRLPGTPNTKHGIVVNVDSSIGNDPKCLSRYTIGELRDHISNFEHIGASEVQTKVENTILANGNSSSDSKKQNEPDSATAWAIPGAPAILVTKDSSPPFDRISNMCDADPQFRATWDRNRHLPSPSEYDMSIANYGTNAGWSPQDIAATLVHFAKRHFPGHLEKLLRSVNGWQDYLHRTISKAYDVSRREKLKREGDSAIEELATSVRRSSELGSEPDKDFILQRTSKILKNEIVGFRQTGRENELFSLLVRQGNSTIEVVIGGASQLRTPRRTLERIVAHCPTLVPETKALKGEWTAIVTALLSIVEYVEIAETDLKERVHTLLREFLHNHSWQMDDGSLYHPENLKSRDSLAMQGKCFSWEDRLHIVARRLQNLARTADPELANGMKLFIGLKQLGFTRSKVQIQQPKTSRLYWVAPPKLSRSLIVKNEEYDPEPVDY